MRLISCTMLLATVLATPATAQESGAAALIRQAKNAEMVREFYPKGSMDAGEEGMVKFRIALDDDGRLESCIVTGSSGYKRLDEATCSLLVATARFKPVREDGQRVVSSHEGELAWVLPTGYRRADAPAFTATATAQLANEELVCKRVPKTGSVVGKTKMCLSRADWMRARENAQAVTAQMQEAKGPFGY